MRTRTRVISASVIPGGNGEVWNNGSYSGPESGYPAISTRMVDETMLDVPTGRGWKPCEHYVRTHYAYTDTEHSWGNYPSNWATRKGPNAYWKVMSSTGPTHWGPNAWPTPSYTKTLEQQIADAENDFFSGNEVNTLLNVIEAPSLLNGVNDLNRWVDSKSVTRALQRVANGYLFWSFGLAPLLADMDKMSKSVKTLKVDMKKALEKTGQQKTVRNSVVGVMAPYTVAASQHDGAWWTFTGRAKRIVSIRGKSGPKLNNSALGQLNYMMGRFGSGGPASFMWERIPFSFVLDWFVDLRGITNKLDNLLTGNTKSISDRLVTTEMALFANMKDTYAHHVPPTFQGTTVASTSIDLYRREIPAAPPMVRSSGRFGKKQLSLAAALLYSKVASRLGR